MCKICECCFHYEDDGIKKPFNPIGKCLETGDKVRHDKEGCSEFREYKWNEI